MLIYKFELPIYWVFHILYKVNSLDNHTYGPAATVKLLHASINMFYVYKVHVF